MSIDGGDRFVGRCEVVEPRRGNRRWPDDLKARIVAESFQPEARVVDVARRHGMVAYQLSDWRPFARQGLLTAGRAVAYFATAEFFFGSFSRASVCSAVGWARTGGICGYTLRSGDGRGVHGCCALGDHDGRNRFTGCASGSGRCGGRARGGFGACVAGSSMIVAGQRLPILIATRPPLVHASMHCRAAGGLPVWSVRRIRKRSGGPFSRRTLWR